ncbi:MAG: hypothetical protein DRP74_08085 [Candidatus Omnitrophota bacterium]|nr:MAG: hypothetical protein DRP74_08085 [Candidatus Omnitrophota bacterium]
MPRRRPPIARPLYGPFIPDDATIYKVNPINITPINTTTTNSKNKKTPTPEPPPLPTTGSGWFRFKGISYPVFPDLPTWQPEYSPQWQNYINEMYNRMRAFMESPGMTPEEEQLLRAKAIERIRQNAAIAQQQAMQRLAEMGLLGSPAGAKLLQNIARETVRQEAEFQRDLTLEQLRRAFQERATAMGLGQKWAGLGTQIEQMKNQLSLAAAEYLRRNLLAEHQAAAGAAALAMRRQALEEQINKARRMELFSLLKMLSGYMSGQQRMQVAEQQLLNQQYAMQMQQYMQQQQSIGNLFSNLGSLLLVFGGL